MYNNNQNYSVIDCVVLILDMNIRKKFIIVISERITQTSIATAVFIKRAYK
jgi:hypothetical protein